jgi:hypothetical protein
LAFYGIIPEAVLQITSVTSLKTTNFKNAMGEFSYKSLRNDLFFGYDLKTIASGQTIQIAQPEKALLDLLYLYPFYKTERDFEDLRLDEDFMQDEFNWNQLGEYVQNFKNKLLEKRVDALTNIYRT